MISEFAKAVTKRIYKRYGTDSGFIMGIHPDLRSSIEAIVESTIEILYKER